MRTTTCILLGLLAASTTGCRTVWVHPEATQEKYSHDMYWCRYGAEPPDPNKMYEARPVLHLHRDWPICMESLHWSKTTGVRSDKPYRRSTTSAQ